MANMFRSSLKKAKKMGGYLWRPRRRKRAAAAPQPTLPKMTTNDKREATGPCVGPNKLGNRNGENQKPKTGADEVIPQTPGMSVDVVPTRYLSAAGGDMEKARERWGKTFAWRTEAQMDEAIYEEWWQMNQLKKEYRHCFHRRAKNGSVVYYDRLE